MVKQSPPQVKPQAKQSYERSAEVQRWLETQTEQEEDSLLLGPVQEAEAFNPRFLSSHHERAWLMSSLSAFYEQCLITDVLGVVKSGKEATVYCCQAHPSTGVEHLAAKIYRPRMFRSLKNDAVYREGRAVRDERGRMIRNRRAQRAANGQSPRGRALQVEAWIAHEFETLRLAYAAGADVPRPMAQIGNAILMGYVGEAGDPAPHLNRVTLERDEAQPLFECVMRNIARVLACDRVHGDLSAYNILYWQGTITVIDFAQAVDPRSNGDAFALLQRDVERVYQYFARYGVVADPADLAAALWTRYWCSELEGAMTA